MRVISLRLGWAFDCVLMALIMMNLALGEEAYEEPKEAIVMTFDTQQSISGTGIMSSYRYINNDPLVLKSHSSGSGSYSSDSNIRDEGITISNIEYQDYTSSTQNIEFNENVSAAYFPTTIDIQGSARFGPIKSTWSDSTLTGNRGGAAIRARFDHARALVKNIATKILGSESFETIYSSTGSFEDSMRLKSAFNGSAQLSVSTVRPAIEQVTLASRLKESDRRVPTTTMDEYYIGTYSLDTTIKIADEGTLSTEEDDWASCCLNGYMSMPTYYQRGTYGFGSNAKGVFDCTCFKAAASAEFQKVH